MNVDELYRLGTWYAEQFSELDRRYTALRDPINHNANQSDKRPLEIDLNNLIEFLSNQRFEELSLEQLKVLNIIGVDSYLGESGADYVTSSVKTSDYDPATAYQRLNQAIDVISSARDRLSSYVQSVKNLKLAEEGAKAIDGMVTIRVGFQNDVAINNVADWKNSAKDWYEIVRGLAMACDESPEDIKVTGASTGSVILILAGTAGFTALLALICRHLTTAAKDIIGVRMAMEDLRQKKILNKAMETEFKKLEQDKVTNTVSDIQQALSGRLKGDNGEIDVALTASIKKLLTFSERGGTVDFVAPDVGEDSEGGDEVGDPENGLRAALLEAKAAIREYQGEREGLKLLSDGTKLPPR